MVTGCPQHAPTPPCPDCQAIKRKAANRKTKFVLAWMLLCLVGCGLALKLDDSGIAFLCCLVAALAGHELAYRRERAERRHRFWWGY